MELISIVGLSARFVSIHNEAALTTGFTNFKVVLHVNSHSMHHVLLLYFLAVQLTVVSLDYLMF